jgi:hypothetical protein
MRTDLYRIVGLSFKHIAKLMKFCVDPISLTTNRDDAVSRNEKDSWKILRNLFAYRSWIGLMFRIRKTLNDVSMASCCWWVISCSESPLLFSSWSDMSSSSRSYRSRINSASRRETDLLTLGTSTDFISFVRCWQKVLGIFSIFDVSRKRVTM